MADFLLVVEGLAADGADAAMIVDETTYLAALFGHVFAPDDGAVLGYVWCSRHGWVRGDETRICDSCWIEAMKAQIVDEFPQGEFDDGQHWRQPAQALSLLSPGQWASEPCGDPERTEEDLDAAAAHMD